MLCLSSPPASDLGRVLVPRSATPMINDAVASKVRAIFPGTLHLRSLLLLCLHILTAAPCGAAAVVAAGCPLPTR